MDVSKRSVFEQEGFLVTFKVYSLENFSITGLKYPEFEGFLVQEVELPQEKQLTLENYNGRNYQSAVMRQVILYPQRSGKITIEGGSMMPWCVSVCNKRAAVASSIVFSTRIGM